MTKALLQTDLPLANRRRGKVRDTYEMTYERGGERIDALAIVATDRLSAFDVVMPGGVPGKGVVLNQISRFWFDWIGRTFGDTMPIHVLEVPDEFTAGGVAYPELSGRVTVGRRAEVVPIECVARGYLAGSGWKEYRETGSVCGVRLPEGLKWCDKLPEPIFTPATKAETGHDENIDFETACAIVGRPVMEKMRAKTLAIYSAAHDYAADRGLLLADTKFEFGTVRGESGGQSGEVGEGELVLIDEILSPDSSRFWPADRYEPGRDQDSFDKQYVRNHLEALVGAGVWDKAPPGPVLPDLILENTLAKYLEAYELLTGSPLELSRFAYGSV